MATIGLTGGAGATGGININGTERVTIDTSGNVTLASGGVDVANVASINGTGFGGFRNKIIGGDFTTNPWQRGTSFTAASNAYTADRFEVGSTGTTAVVNLLKTADAPTAAEAGVYTTHCLHIDVTTADAAVGAADLYNVRQKIEGLNAASFGFGQSGTRYVTLSFWHKHTKTGIYCVSFANSALNRSYIAEYTQDTTDTWEKATITIPVDTSGTWLYDSGVGLYVFFTAMAGSNFQTTANAWSGGQYYATSNQVNALDSTSNNFKIALVQLEAGSVATPFETRSVGQELALCQRYYYRVNGGATGEPIGSLWATSTTTAAGVNFFPVPLRIAPTAIEQSGTAADYQVYAGSTQVTCSAVPTFNVASRFVALTTLTVASSLTGGQAGFIRSANANPYLGWSAEL